MILHLKLPNAICINQQSDLLMHSSGQKKEGYSSSTLYHTSKWKGRPPPTPPPPLTSTQLNIPKTDCFPQRFILCSKMEQLFYLFRRIDALLQRFLLLRSILSEPGNEKTCLRGFGPVKIQSGLLSYRC